jgi:hypothetical protein
VNVALVLVGLGAVVAALALLRYPQLTSWLPDGLAKPMAELWGKAGDPRPMARYLRMRRRAFVPLYWLLLLIGVLAIGAGLLVLVQPE